MRRLRVPRLVRHRSCAVACRAGCATRAPTAIGYGAQVRAYLLLVTDRYPNADPTSDARVGAAGRRVHPVRLVGDAHDLRRSRLTVFFRLPLRIPTSSGCALVDRARSFAVIMRLVRHAFSGHRRGALHRFISSLVRYELHVYAFLLLSRTRSPASPVHRARIRSTSSSGGPQRQNRWKTGFRLFLLVPALLVDSALWYGLFTSRGPHLVLRARHRLRAVGTAQPLGLRAPLPRADERVRVPLTDRYPHASPLEGEDPSRRGRSNRRATRRIAAARCSRAAVGGCAHGCSGARRCRRTTCRTSTSTRCFPSHELHRAQHYSERGASPLAREDDHPARGARPLRALRRPLDARVGGRADRHRDAARDDRLRASSGRRSCRLPS